MNNQPPKHPYDQDRDSEDDDYTRQLFVLVTVGTVVVLVVLIVMTFLNGCVQDIERPPPTLPTIPPLTLGFDHITVPTTTTTIPVG